jgi:hypothetical protein
MESIIIKPGNKKDLKILKQLAERLGLPFSIITEDEQEEIGLARAIDEGRKTKNVSKATIIKRLKKVD